MVLIYAAMLPIKCHVDTGWDAKLRGQRERWPVLQAHAWADGIMEAAVASVSEQLRRPKEFIYQGMLERQSARIKRTLDLIAAMPLAQEPGIATITLGCALGYLDFRMPQLAWRDGRAALSRWYEQFAQRRSMQATKSP